MDPGRLRPELIEAVCIDDFTLRKEFGRERGLNPTPTEAQKQALNKLNQQLQVKLKASKSKKDVREALEPEVQFDLMSRTRVIIWRSNVLKKHAHALASLTLSEKRQAILLNDVFLLTSDHSTGDWLMSSEKLMMHQAIPLTQLAFRDLAVVSTEDVDPGAFEIINMADESRITLVAESENAKKIWLEELELAVFCLKSAEPYKNVGWQHEVVRSTVYSAAMYGDTAALKRFMEARNAKLDEPDESGMCPLHWACLFGRKDVVVDLVESGHCNVDVMNSGLNTPLMLASAMGHADITFYLIESGADVHYRNLRDMDCMYMCVLFGCTSTDLYDIISVLQRKDVDINQKDSTGSSPLHQCALSGNPRPIQALVDSGADVNMKHGRNGMTPLQLACSTNNPDAETVRTLLDKGAHPNWKDASMRSSFDLVLLGHKNKMERSLEKPIGSAKGSGREPPPEPLNEIQEFIQVALPVLMELVRKGARYTPESIAALRPSFQEAINSGQTHWTALVENDDFQSFVDSIPGQLCNNKNWVDDKASLACLLCLDKFSFSNRRHHCRTCGALVCDLCSAKRMHTTKAAVTSGGKGSPVPPGRRGSASSVSAASPPPAPAATAANGSKKIPSGDRVCDGCFNKLSHECFLWQQALQRVRRNQERLAAENPELLLNEASLDGPAAGGGKSSASSVDTAKNVAMETRRALEQRGERLQQAAERSEEMRQGASDFKQMTTELLRQQREKQRGWM